MDMMLYLTFLFLQLFKLHSDSYQIKSEILRKQIATILASVDYSICQESTPWPSYYTAILYTIMPHRYSAIQGLISPKVILVQ